MAITRTGIQVDTNQNFTNPLDYYESGVASRVTATQLQPSTRYYTRAYVVQDGTTYYSQSMRSFMTETPNYLSFTNNSGGQTDLEIKKVGAPNSVVLEYSTDRSLWEEKDISDGDEAITIMDNETIYLRGTSNTEFSNSPDDYYYFACADTLEASGNVLSLVDPTTTIDTIPCAYCFTHLFDGMSVMTVDDLTLTATTLNEGCYAYMFANCTDLATPIVIMGVDADIYCFDSMFFNCPNFDTVTVYIADYNEDYCSSWLKGCASVGTVYNLGGASFHTDTDDGIPENWTEIN